MGCANVKGILRKSVMRKRGTHHGDSECLTQPNRLCVNRNRKSDLKTIFEVRSYLEVSHSQDNALQ